MAFGKVLIAVHCGYVWLAFFSALKFLQVRSDFLFIFYWTPGVVFAHGSNPITVLHRFN